MPIAIVDYCKGNLRSVQRGLELAGSAAVITADPDEIARAEAIVLPGVGSFHDASAYMVDSGQMAALRDSIRAGVPFLGICLGLQLLFERGAEGAPEGWDEGIGILAGEAVHMERTREDGSRVKIPHVGWNDVFYTRESALFAGVPDGSYFYFTHSFIAKPCDDDDMIGRTEHARRFASAVQKDNVFGVQFHPEKSSARGLKVLENFVHIIYGV